MLLTQSVPITTHLVPLHERKDSTETRVTKIEEIMQRGINRLYFQKRVVLFRK